MRVFFAGLAAFLVAAIAGWMATIAVYVLGTEFKWWFDRDGGGAMAFAFVIGPAVALVAGIVAAVGVVVWMGRRRAGK